MSIALILNALTAIPAIAGYVQSFVTAIITWWVQKQNNETYAAIADAAALSAKAQSDSDRFAAAAAWEAALSRPRVSSS